MKAETLQALKVVSSNYSFASTTDDAERFRLMFPDLPTAVKYQQSRTKVNYVIKHGMSPYVKDLYINDFSGTPSKLLGLYQNLQNSRNRYEEELKSIEQKKINRAKVKTSQEKNELVNIDNETRKIERGIEGADKAIRDGSKKLEQHLASKTLDAEKFHSDNELIQMGLQRKRKLADDLSNLKRKKNLLLK